jgi:hypothetical protein
LANADCRDEASPSMRVIEVCFWNALPEIQPMPGGVERPLRGLGWFA